MTNAKSFIPWGRDGSAQMVIGAGMDSFLSGSPLKNEQQKNLAGETQRVGETLMLHVKIGRLQRRRFE